MWPKMSMSITSKALIILGLSLVVLAMTAAQQRKLPPDYERKREALAKFESGVVPLLILGDLNEDGEVDQKDLALLREYVSHGKNAGISCLAAADLDDNGIVNAKDTVIIEDVLSRGTVKAPALSAHGRLGCDFKQFFIAARPQGRPGDNVPIHFLDGVSNSQNSKVIVTAGPATVAPARDGFLVRIATDAPSDSIITVSITLASQRRYFYSFSVGPR